MTNETQKIELEKKLDYLEKNRDNPIISKAINMEKSVKNQIDSYYGINSFEDYILKSSKICGKYEKQPVKNMEQIIDSLGPFMKEKISVEDVASRNLLRKEIKKQNLFEKIFWGTFLGGAFAALYGFGVENPILSLGGLVSSGGAIYIIFPMSDDSDSSKIEKYKDLYLSASHMDEFIQTEYKQFKKYSQIKLDYKEE